VKLFSGLDLVETRFSELDLEEINIRNMVSFYRDELESINNCCYTSIPYHLSMHLRELGLTRNTRGDGKDGRRIIFTDFGRSLLKGVQSED
jgi:hypothetical protein